MVGQLSLLLYLFTKLNFSLMIKLDVLPCLNILFDHVTSLVNLRIDGEFSFYFLINDRFRCKSKLSTLLRLEWSFLISFLENINDQNLKFVEKSDLSSYKLFFVKRGTVIPNV